MTTFSCYWHTATKENETDCGAHLAEARIFPCPYSDAREASKRCADYESAESEGAAPDAIHNTNATSGRGEGAHG